jgi:hypothetical protein
VDEADVTAAVQAIGQMTILPDGALTNDSLSRFK